MSARKDNLWRASELARAASDNLIHARAFDANPAKREAYAKEAEAALNEALELIWQSGETARERFVRVAGGVSAAPYENQAERLVA